MRSAQIRGRFLRNRITRLAIRFRLPIEERADLMRLGSGYGGWWVPEGLIRSGGIAYCAGVGNDITFDLELIERHGFEVWAFDPTPSVIDAVSGWETPPGWHFEPLGLWDSVDRIRFYLPTAPGMGSVSATNALGRDEFVEAPVETLDAIMRRLGHDHIDLLKMDIEGAEGPVLRAMIAADILPTVLCVEFDQPEAPWRVAQRIRVLLDAGYVLHKAETWNFTFSRAGAQSSDASSNS